MPVDTRDPAWAEHIADRDKVAALFSGRETAKEYVRSLPGWEGDSLTMIQDGVYFLPIVARTVETFGGLVFQKAPQRTLPTGLKPYLDDVTQTGQEIDRFAEQSLDGVMQTGAIMVLVDYPASDEPMTRAEAEAMGRRPVLKLYDGNSILAARKTLIRGVLKLTHVRVLEDVEEPDASDPNDPFKLTAFKQVRVLELVDGLYQQTVWRQGDGGWTAGEVIVPLMDGKPLDRIPAEFSNTRDGEARPAKPPLTDLADISIAHLNNSAQYEWALAWLGSPILFGAGIELANGETIQMGASSAVISPNKDAKLEIVQADGAKFGGLKGAMDDKRRDAAAMGARMLLEGQRSAITAETSRIEKAGETSVVVSMANAVSQCLTNSIRFLAKWASVSGADNGLYWLNDKLLPASMTPEKLKALLEAWAAEAITEAELFAQLQEGEVIDPAKTFEEHIDEKVQERPDPADAEDLSAALDPALKADPNAEDDTPAQDPARA